MQEKIMNKEQVIAFLKMNKEFLLEKYHISILAIYGSYARDMANEQSDIDIVYERKDSLTYQNFIDAEEFLNSKLHRKVELVNMKYMNPIVKKTAEMDFIYV